MNFLDLAVARDGQGAYAMVGTARLPLPDAVVGSSPRERIVLGLRPEHLLLNPPAGHNVVLNAEVGEIEFTGAQSQITVSTAAGPLTVCAADRPALRAGEHVPLGVDTSRLHFFDFDTELRLGPAG